MTPEEFFDDLTKKFPRWWRPHEQWRSDVLKICSKFQPRQIAKMHAVLTQTERRPTLEDLEIELAQQSGDMFAPTVKKTRSEITADWMARQNLTEAFNRAGHSARFAIERLVFFIHHEDGWERKLANAAGLAVHWKPWERIEHLHDAASRATVNGVRIMTEGRNGELKPPIGDYVVDLPPWPVWVPEEEKAERMAKLSEIIKRHGGMRNGLAITADKEYRQHLVEGERRMAQLRAEQYGDTLV